MAKRKKKRRRQKPTARPRMEAVGADILAGVVSGLITAEILRLLKW